MLEIPHAIVGAAIGYKIGNPLIAFPASFLSHFILDELPHWNPHLGNNPNKFKLPLSRDTKIIIADSTIALLAGSAIAASKLPDLYGFTTIMLSALFSVLPDLIEAPFFFLNCNNTKIRKWLNFQRRHQNNTNVYWGLATQVIVVVASLAWIFA